MTVNVGINGFGRIGRQVLKAIQDDYPGELEVVSFNDIGDLYISSNLYTVSPLSKLCFTEKSLPSSLFFE